MSLLLLMALAEPPAHKARAQVAPGISLVFAPGWVACDGGGAMTYRMAGVARTACGRGLGSGQIAMRYMASGQPIDLWINHIDNPTASEDALKVATPDGIRKTSDALCAMARNRPEYAVFSCSWTRGTLAGHTVMRQRGSVIQVVDPLKLQYDVDGFSIADRTGYTTVVATTPAMVHAKTAPIIAALFASLSVDATPPADAAPAPPTPAQLIALSPVPGVSLQIPREWVACDDKSEALLTSARDSMKLKPKVCADPPSSFRAFDPRPFHVLSVLIDYHAQQVLTAEALADMHQQDIDTLRSGICAQEARTLPDPVADCQIMLGTLAGHAALVSKVVSILPDGGKWLIESYEVPYPQGYLQIQFAHAELIDKLVKPELDTIRESVHIDDTGPPPADAKPGEAPAAPPTPPVIVPKNSI